MLDKGIQMAPFVRTAAGVVQKAPIANITGAVMRSGVMNADFKGEKKWAADGFANLMKHGNDSDKAMLGSKIDKLMADQGGRELLVQASDLKPGTKAMDNLLDRVKARIGGAK